MDKVPKEIFVSANCSEETWIVAKLLLWEIFCTLSSQLELETQQTQFRAVSKRETEISFISTPNKKNTSLHDYFQVCAKLLLELDFVFQDSQYLIYVEPKKMM